MDRTKDHNDNPEFILRGWEDIVTGKFYLIFFNLKSNKIEIKLTNSNNKIFKIRGFHPSAIDSQFIQPYETTFSKLLPNLDYPKRNHIAKIHNDIGMVVDFCARQIVRGQNFRSATKQLHDNYGEAEWKTVINRYNLTSLDNIIEYYTVKGKYKKLLRIENVLPWKSEEYARRLSSMECWGIHVNPRVGEFITGAQPYFFEIEGEDFGNMDCLRSARFVITPNFSIAFCDDEFGFGSGNLFPLDDKEANEIIQRHNTEVLKRSQYNYIISRTLPFIGYDLDHKLKLEIDSYLENNNI